MVLSHLEKQLGYIFNDVVLLETALTHRSFRKNHNERLEFLGDSILNFIIADALYQQFSKVDEGMLSRMRANLVNRETLAELAKEFALGDYLRLGSGELRSGGHRRDSTVADALEALIGAIYLDSGFNACRERVLDWFGGRLNAVSAEDIKKDAKSRLQEYLQSRKLPLPIYEVLKLEGEAHNQKFTVSCKVKGLEVETKGLGTSRRRAEQKAAEKFLGQL